jgi:Leucine-rich repeat (LRR) protein
MGLKGEFPRGIRNCTSLTGLDFSLNSLSKSIPNDISKLVAFVTTLDLSSNDFTGVIPLSLSNCTYLNSLKLDYNQLTGQIPPQFAQLTRLKMFSVSNNLLTGQVPNFGNAVSITEDSYANNSALCGGPLKSCTKSSKTNTAVIAGAAVGGVTLAALGVSVGLFFYVRRVSYRKKEDDPEGNKWARILKGTKKIKVG